MTVHTCGTQLSVQEDMSFASSRDTDADDAAHDGVNGCMETVHREQAIVGTRPRPLIAVSLTAQFFIEIAGIAALAYWGANVGTASAARIGLAVTAPALAIAYWATFGAPKAPHRQQGARRVLVELAFFGCAAGAMWRARQHPLAIGYALLVTANLTLLGVLGHDR